MNCCFVIHTRRRRINRKKVVATESALRGRACKPLADGSVLFCGKGAMTQRLKIPLGLSERDHNREVHRDVAEMERFELSRRFTHPTPLAGEPLRPTWVHLRIKDNLFYCRSILPAPKKWRRRWDSNPRYLSVSLVFKTSSLNPSDTSPHRGKE